VTDPDDAVRTGTSPDAADRQRELVELVERLDGDNERLRLRVLEVMEWLESSASDAVAFERERDTWHRQADNLDAEIAALRSTMSWRVTRPLRRLGTLRSRRRSSTPAASARSTPSANDRVAVFVPVRDRVTPLLALVDWLERAGHDDIWLVDNASTFPPMLDYLDTTPHRVVRLGRNMGHRSPFLSGAVQRHAGNRRFVITDPDVVPDDACPLDAIAHFSELLDRYPEIDKVGFGLRIDDLPDSNPLVGQIRAWEERFWLDEVEPGVFRADIDTTFALYRPLDRRHREDAALRTGAPYVARHTPWYLDPGRLTDEDRWYREHAEPSIMNWDRDEIPRWKQRWLDEHADRI
jgi:hypothetical protein